jgi:hypothetical protein
MDIIYQKSLSMCDVTGRLLRMPLKQAQTTICISPSVSLQCPTSLLHGFVCGFFSITRYLTRKNSKSEPKLRTS